LTPPKPPKKGRRLDSRSAREWLLLTMDVFRLGMEAGIVQLSSASRHNGYNTVLI